MAWRPGPRPSHVPKRSRAWTGWAFVPSRKPRQWHRPRRRGQFEPVALHRGCWVDSAEPSMLFVWSARHARRCYSIGGTRRFCKAQDASSKQTKEQMARWIVPWHRRLGARKIGLRTRGGGRGCRGAEGKRTEDDDRDVEVGAWRCSVLRRAGESDDGHDGQTTNASSRPAVARPLVRARGPAIINKCSLAANSGRMGHLVCQAATSQ